MKKVRGTFEELMNPAYISKDVKADDYVQITLTDEDDVPNAMSRLQGVYKNALELRYDNARTRANASALNASVEEQKSAFALFEEFFELQNNAKMTDEQSEYMKDLIEKIEGESV
jgi:exonuclease SbcD